MSVKCLLIVDDEDILLGLLRRFLERQGFHVKTCLTAEAAWTAFCSEPDGIAMVIADLNLDDGSGAELVERMRAVRPALPALITSGQPHVPPRGVGFLQKPFLPQMLVDEVNRALGGGNTSQRG